MEKRLAFLRRQRNEDESIRDYAEALKALAAEVGFEESKLDERLRDQFLVGMANSKWASELCREERKFDDLVARAMELESEKTIVASVEEANDGSWRQFPGRLSGGHLRFMTFNIWNSGSNVENGLAKIAKHISYINPDIIALQEVDSVYVLIELTRLLGPDWSYVGRNQTRPDSGILTRHAIVGQYVNDDASTKARVRVQFLDGTSIFVNFWSLHLDYHDYGPYAACNKLVTAPYQIEAGEHYIGGSVPGRVENIMITTSLDEFKKDLRATDQDAMIVAGDLNCPSHLDWTEATKSAHCDWVYEWPVTKVIIDNGLTDAFREIYPDPNVVPAHTWSTVQKSQAGWGGTIPEPQDRIDMIFYKSPRWSPVAAKVYVGSEPLTPEPNHYHNDWPSDHASVVLDFKAK